MISDFKHDSNVTSQFESGKCRLESSKNVKLPKARVRMKMFVLKVWNLINFILLNFQIPNNFGQEAKAFWVRIY